MSEHRDDPLVTRLMQAAAGTPAATPCPDAEVLGLFAERALDGEERDLVEAHVAGCARCQATVAASVRSAPEIAAGELATAAAVPWWMRWRWLAPVAATAAVVVVAVWLDRGAGSRQAMFPGPPAGSSEQLARPDMAREATRPDAPTGGAPTAAPDSAEAPPVASGGEAQASAARTERRERTPSETPAGRARVPAPAAPLVVDGRTPAAAAAPPADTRAKAAPPPPAAVAPAPPAEEPSETIRAEEASEAIRVSPAPAPAPRAGARAAQRADASTPTGEPAAGANNLTAAAGMRGAATLSGRLTYRTRAALPAGAIIDVRLYDVSLADAPATLLGRVEIVTRGEQVPVPFALAYDGAAIDPRHRYALQATVTIDGRVAYRTTASHTVLTSGAPSTDVEVVVEPMR